MNFSAEQRSAIDARNTNILLSAAAGSGKTTVLVERVLQLILNDNASIDKMLVVTFSKASAADMRAKLQRKLTERAAEGDPRFHEQLMLLSQAHISTIHSFCSDFLRQNFEKAQVDPEFTILDASAARQLRENAIEDALEAAYADYDTDEALRALDYGRMADGVREAVGLLMDKLEERPDPEAWLAEHTTDAKAILDAACGCLMDSARRHLRAALNDIQAAIDVDERPVEYDDAFNSDKAQLEALLACEDYIDLQESLAAVTFKRAKPTTKKSVFDPFAKEKASKLRDSQKKRIEKAQNVIKPFGYHDALADIEAQLPQLKKLCELTLDAVRRFNEAKDDRAALTYNDLEHRTLEALRDDSVAQNLREAFDYIFIDEYQDTSDLQESIVRRFAREDNVFTVGDVKQSIYRFRNAEPRLFLDKSARYAKGEGGLLLPLTRNFRSERGILDFINMLFEHTMIGGDTEILYDKDAHLNPGDDKAPTGDGNVEIHIIEENAIPEEPEPERSDEVEEALREMNGNQREGLFIARRIRSLMAEDENLRFSDIAIIQRRRGAFGDIANALLSEGIPVFADGVSGFYDSLEISHMITLLELILNPGRDIQMIAALHSPIVNLSAEALARIRIAFPEAYSYVSAVRSYAEQKEDGIAQKLRDFLAKLNRWELQQDALSLGAFIRLLMDESGFYTYAGALPGGAQRLANLDLFVADACAFDATYGGSLTRFVEHTKFLKERSETEAARLLTENDNVVRIITIHHSKGLEYPVVFCPCLQSKYHTTKPDSSLLFDKDLGIAIPFFDSLLQTRRDTAIHAAIRQQESLRDRAEELRLLYVMLTRAKSRLILSATPRYKTWVTYVEGYRTAPVSPVLCNSFLDVIANAIAQADTLYCTQHSHAIDSFIPATGKAAETTPSAELFDAIMHEPGRYADPLIAEAMNWEYPWPNDSKRPLKLTVSGLVRELEGPETVDISVITTRPQFMQGEAIHMTGAERGTAYHRVMELLQLEPLRGLHGEALESAVTAQMDAFAERSLMSKAQRGAVKPSRIVTFVESDIGQRLIHAETVRREWSFNAILRAGDVLTSDEVTQFGDDPLMVQGTIDCCFMEDGQWVLLDYKTDSSRDLEALKEHYRKQLKAYAVALKNLTGIPVKQSMLFLVGMGKQLDMA